MAGLPATTNGGDSLEISAVQVLKSLQLLICTRRGPCMLLLSACLKTVRVQECQAGGWGCRNEVGGKVTNSNYSLGF